LAKDGTTVLTSDQLMASINATLGERKEMLMSENEFNAALRSAEGDGLLVRRGKTIEVKR